jgi:hypothetical protein
MANTEQYLRRATVQINGKKYTGLRFAFQIEKSLKSEPNQAELRVWNLSEDSRKQLTKDVYIAIDAGYEGDTSTVFKGNLNKVDHQRQGPDWVTRARIGDGEKEIKKARVSTSLPRGAKPEQIVGNLLQSLTGVQSNGFDFKLAAGNALSKIKQGDKAGAIKELSNGFTAIGSAYDKLVLLGNNMGYDVSIQDKQITFLEPDATLGELDFLYTPETGLVGSPEQVQKDHIKAKVLLNAKITPGIGIRLQSFGPKGRYRVEKMALTGDTHGTEWFCDLLLKRLGN